MVVLIILNDLQLINVELDLQNDIGVKNRNTKYQNLFLLQGVS